MKAVDTNVLVYAVIRGSLHHHAALAVLDEIATRPDRWAIPWPCLYEFLRVVTHPRIYHPPVPLDVARADLNAILASPSLVLLSETERHQEMLDAVLAESEASGNLIHDAHIAALCREHGVSELLTADRDFARFSGFRVTNPFSAR